MKKDWVFIKENKFIHQKFLRESFIWGVEREWWWWRGVVVLCIIYCSNNLSKKKKNGRKFCEKKQHKTSSTANVSKQQKIFITIFFKRLFFSAPDSVNNTHDMNMASLRIDFLKNKIKKNIYGFFFSQFTASLSLIFTNYFQIVWI